jgi:hypothetical protein
MDRLRPSCVLLLVAALVLGAAGASCAGDGLCDGEPAGTPCRPAAGVCDVPEACNGLSPDCPVDALASPAVACRPSVEPCDLADFCTGTSAACGVFDRVRTGFDAVTCVFERAMPPAACAADALPARIAQAFAKAGTKVRAPAKTSQAKRRQICRARRLLTRGLRVVERRIARPARGWSVACATAVYGLMVDALARVQTSAECPKR